MKIQIAVIIVVAMAALAGCGAASSTGDTTIEGNIGDMFDLSVDVAHGYLSLPNPPGSISLPANLIVTSNGPWLVTVKSDRPDGKMTEWNSSSGAYITQNPHRIWQPMHVIYYPMRDVTLADQDRELIPQNDNYGTNIHYPIIFSQATTGYQWGSNDADQRVNPPDVYRIIVIFTGSMSY